MPTIIERPDPTKIQPLVQRPLIAGGSDPASVVPTAVAAPAGTQARTPIIIEAPDPTKIQIASTKAPQAQQQFEPEFVAEVNRVAAGMNITPDDLMAVMDTESKLDPTAVNPHSGATGILQWMPKTAKGLGVTTADLAKMTRAQQMAYVEKYLAPYKGRIQNRNELYLSVLNPQNIGDAPESVMKSGETEWRAGTPYYDQNKGLDIDGKGFITVADATRRVSNWDRALSEAGKSVARESLNTLQSVGGTLPEMVVQSGVSAFNSMLQSRLPIVNGMLPPDQQIAQAPQIDASGLGLAESARRFYDADRASLAPDTFLTNQTYTGLGKQVLFGEKPDVVAEFNDVKDAPPIPADRGVAATDFGTKLLSDVAGIAPSMASTVMGFLVGGPAGAGVTGGFLEGASQYDAAIAQGKSPEKAAEEFGVTAVGTGLLNSIPFLRAFDRFLPDSYKGMAARMFLSSLFEGASETAEGGVKPIAEMDKVPTSPAEAWELLVKMGKGVYDESGVFLPAMVTGIAGGGAKEASEPPTVAKVTAESLVEDFPEEIIDGLGNQQAAQGAASVGSQPPSTATGPAQAPTSEDDLTGLLNVGTDEVLPEERKALLDSGFTDEDIDTMQPDQLQQALATVFGEGSATISPPRAPYTMEDAQAEMDRIFTREDKAEAIPIVAEEMRTELDKAETGPEQIVAAAMREELDKIEQPKPQAQEIPDEEGLQGQRRQEKVAAPPQEAGPQKQQKPYFESYEELTDHLSRALPEHTISHVGHSVQVLGKYNDKQLVKEWDEALPMRSDVDTLVNRLRPQEQSVNARTKALETAAQNIQAIEGKAEPVVNEHIRNAVDRLKSPETPAAAVPAPQGVRAPSLTTTDVEIESPASATEAPPDRGVGTTEVALPSPATDSTPTRRERIAQRRAAQMGRKAELTPVADTDPQPAGPRNQYAIPGMEDTVATSERDDVDRGALRDWLDEHLPENSPVTPDRILEDVWPAARGLRAEVETGISTDDAVGTAREREQPSYLQGLSSDAAQDVDEAVLRALDSYAEWVSGGTGRSKIEARESRERQIKLMGEIYPDLHRNSIEKMVDAVDTVDVEKIVSILHPGNPTSHSLFESLTGEKFPPKRKRTQKAVHEQVRQWAANKENDPDLRHLFGLDKPAESTSPEEANTDTISTEDTPSGPEVTGEQPVEQPDVVERPRTPRRDAAPPAGEPSSNTGEVGGTAGSEDAAGDRRDLRPPADGDELRGSGGTGKPRRNPPRMGGPRGAAGEAVKRDGDSEAGSVQAGSDGVAKEKADDGKRNHRIGEGDTIAPDGQISKIRANLRALRILKELEEQKREATPAEQKALAQYTGWGHSPQVFDEKKGRWFESEYPYSVSQRDTNWGDKFYEHYKEAKELLSPAEWTAALKSTQYAHYTAKNVVQSMWKIAERLGFSGGRVLEPGAGVGNFLGLMPEGFKGATFVAVELDDTSGRILQKLYPKAKVFIKGFQDAKIPANSVDLVITNVPFSSNGPKDTPYPTLSLHNYFFARSLDVLKPGGVMVAISSHFTMDANAKQREFLASKGNLIGAIRLPNNAFRKNAGTDVTTDIIILQKPSQSFTKGEPWAALANVGTDDAPIMVNEYFAAHPEMVLGTHSMEGSMYGGDGTEYTVQPIGGDLTEQMRTAIEELPAGIIGAPVADDIDFGAIDEAAGEKEGSFHTRGGKVVRVESGSFVDAGLTAALQARAKDFIGLRDHYRQHLALMRKPETTDEQFAESLGELNRLYDAYSKKHGGISEGKTKVFRSDPGYFLLAGTEKTTTVIDPATKRKAQTTSKGDVYSKRTIDPSVRPQTAGSAEDALRISLTYRGQIDSDYIAQLTGKSAADVLAELSSSGLVFINPETGLAEISALYLSGNVKKKLAIAKDAGDAYKANVAALEKVLPARVPYSGIKPQLGATWVPDSLVQKFADEVLGRGFGTIKVSYLQAADSWMINTTAGGAKRDALGPRGLQEFAVIEKSKADPNSPGYLRRHALDVLHGVLNLKDLIIKDKDSDGKEWVNEDLTREARIKAEQLKEAFITWINSNADRMSAIEDVYNEHYNFYVPPVYDGSHLSLPGKSNTIKLRAHQLNAIWRMIVERRGMVAHAVGAGKTFEIIAASMEMRRLGIAKKPMIVVQNSTMEQYARAFTQLYPSANVLVADVESLKKDKRKQFLAHIAASDYDAVIIAQSQFDRLPSDPATEATVIQNLIDELRKAHMELEEVEGKRSPSVKQLAKSIEKLEDRLHTANAKMKGRQDDVIYFESLGVDTLFIDEAHSYKKPPFVTKMPNLLGLNKETSQIATNLMLKTHYIRQTNGGRGVFLATGTPVTNTLGEAWHMLNLTSPDVLAEFGVETFDRFASTFALRTVEWTQNAGGAWVPKSALTRFTNGQELIKLVRSQWDVLMKDDLDQQMISAGHDMPRLEGGAPQIISIDATPRIKEFSEWVKRVYQRYGQLTGDGKKEYSYIPAVLFGASKAVATDSRLVDPNAPDEAGSKVNTMLKKVIEIYNGTKKNKSTQMIFVDMFNPFKMDTLRAFAAGLEDSEAEGDIILDDGEAAEDTEADKEKQRESEVNGFVVNDIIAKLVKAGVKREEIGVMATANTDAKKQAIFDGMNSGELRILIGSTQRMGVGVNAQQKMIALHHLDTPWFPALLEQREGRILRQGNENPEVKIFSYGMKKTLDSAIYSKVLYKAKFIQQILSGKMEDVEFEDPAGQVVLSLEEQMAAFADDPRLFRKLEVANELRDLEIRRRSFLDNVVRAKAKMSELTGSIERLTASVKRLTEEIPDSIVPTNPVIVMDGKEHSIKEFKDLFEKQAEAAPRALMEKGVVASGTKLVHEWSQGKHEKPESVFLHGSVKGTDIAFAVVGGKAHEGLGTEDEKPVYYVRVWSLVGSVRSEATKVESFVNALRAVEREARKELEGVRQTLEDRKKDLAVAQDMAKGGTFPQEDEYQSLKKELDDLNAALSGEGVKPGDTPKPASLGDPIEALRLLIEDGAKFSEKVYERAKPYLQTLFDAAKDERTFILDVVRQVGNKVRGYARKFVADAKRINAEMGNRGAARIPLTSEEEQQMVKDATRVLIFQMRKGVMDSAQLTRTAYAAAVKKLGKPFSVTQFRAIATKAKKAAEPIRAEVAKNQRGNDKQTQRLVGGTANVSMPKMEKGGKNDAAAQVQAILDHVREAEPRGIRAGYRAGRLTMQAQNRELLQFAKDYLPRGEYQMVASAMEAIIKSPPSRGLEAARKVLVRAINKMVEKFEKAGAVKDLKTALSKADKTKLRPEFRKAIDTLLDDLALTDPRQATLARAQSVIDAALKDDIGEIPKRLIDRMKAILADAGKRKVADYSAQEIEDLTNGVLNLLHLNQTKNQLIIGRRRMNRQDAMKKAGEELAARRVKELAEPSRTEAESALTRLATTGQSNLENLALDHAKEGGVVHGILVDDLTAAQTEFLLWQQRAMDAIRPLVERIGYKELAGMSDVLSGYDRVGRTRKAVARIVGDRWMAIQQPKLHDIALPDGGSIKMTGAERSAFYAAWSDPDTRAEMLKDRGKGIVFARDPLKSRMKIDADIARAILATVTDNEKEIAEQMRAHINGPLRKALSEWWVKNHGYDPFKNDEYFPMRRLFDKIGEPEETAFLTAGALDKQGIFQDRVRNARPIIIGDIFGIYLAHANRTAALLGKAAPVNEAMRLLAKDGDFAKAMILRSPRGKSVVDEMRQRVEDFGLIQFQSQDALSAFTHMIIRNSTVANLAFNLPVIVSQPISLLSAQADIQMRYLTAGLTAALRHPKRATEEIFTWVPQLRTVIEGSGHQVVTPESAGATAQEFFGHRGIGTKLMAAISKSNEITVWAIWEAAKAEAAAQGFTGDSLMERAAERATVVYNRSQPNFNMISTAGIKLDARKSAATAVATMYTGQTAVMWQQVRRAVTQYKHGDIDAGTLVKDILVPTLVQGLAFNIIKHGWKLGLVAAGMAAKDDDEDPWVSVLMEALKDSLGIVLIGGKGLDFLLEVIEKRVRGLAITDNTLRYEANPVVSLFMEAGSAINDIVAAAGKVGTKADPQLQRGIGKMLSFLGQFFGIPIRPIVKIAEGML